MRFPDHRIRRLGQAPEVAAASAASSTAMGVPFWQAVGVGVFTGGLVWLLHRGLNHLFPARRA